MRSALVLLAGIAVWGGADGISYTGKKLTPKPVIKYNGTTLTSGTDYTLTDDTSLTSGVAGSVESKRVVADFNLMSAGNKKMEPRTLMRSGTFYAVDCTLSSSSQPIDTPADERYPDVKVLLGAGFMDTQGLTIDFARGIIYQLHVERTA